MVDLADGFAPSISEFQLDGLESFDSSVCGVRPDFTIAYRNPAWRRFAMENGGAGGLERWGLGANLLDAIDEPLSTFFRANLEQCLADGVIWHHEYECSSHEIRRRFRMSVYRTAPEPGLVMVHAIRVEAPMSGPAHDPRMERYVDEFGLVHQCMHCRCYRRREEVNQWDWIPAWVLEPPKNTSHGLCNVCFDYHYPGGLEHLRTHRVTSSECR